MTIEASIEATIMLAVMSLLTPILEDYPRNEFDINEMAPQIVDEFDNTLLIVCIVSKL